MSMIEQVQDQQNSINVQPESAHFSFAAKTKIEDLGGGLQRQMLGFNQELMAVRVIFAPGAEGYVHQHRHSQVSYVISGEFIVSVNGVKQTLTAGDSFYVPPHVDHGAVCPTGGELIDTFSPMREDFIDQVMRTAQAPLSFK